MVFDNLFHSNLTKPFVTSVFLLLHKRHLLSESEFIVNPSMFGKLTTGVPIRKYSKKKSNVTQTADSFRICVVFHFMFFIYLEFLCGFLGESE